MLSAKGTPRPILRTLLICVLAPAAVALAEDRPRNAFNKRAYTYMKDVLVRSAEKMPAESYAFKPTETVRTFGQILGHVADSQYFFCTTALGEKYSSRQIEKTKTSKADLIASLKEAFAYCDKVHEGMTNAVASDTVTFMKEPMAKVDVLAANNMHTIEHYGNLITYLRMKNIVPPSTEMMESRTEKKPAN